MRRKMKEWEVRLEGGPADGDSGFVKDRSLPPKVWAAWCSNCRDFHWYDKPKPFTDSYAMAEQGVNWARYVWEDLLTGDDVSSDWDREPVAA